MYPDVLEFRRLPEAWIRNGFRHDKYESRDDKPDAAEYPRYLLCFNSSKNIIVSHAKWEDQEAAVRIAKLRGSLPEAFLGIRHVGLAAGSLRTKYQPSIGNFENESTWWGTSIVEFRCQTEECQDHYKEEPLTKFLALFPSVETLYIADVPDDVTIGVVGAPGAFVLHDRPELKIARFLFRLFNVLLWMIIPTHSESKWTCSNTEFSQFPDVHNFRI